MSTAEAKPKLHPRQKGEVMKKKPSLRQLKAIAIALEQGGNVGKAMREAGYSAVSANNPKILTESDAWKDIVGTQLSDALIAERHRQLLDSTRLDHMTFPLGPQTEKEEKLLTEMEGTMKTMMEAQQMLSHTDLTDQDIIEMLRDVNCTVRRIVHGQTARHVYFWAADNKARATALDMAYKVKGHYIKEQAPDPGNVINNITQININPPINEPTKPTREIS